MSSKKYKPFSNDAIENANERIIGQADSFDNHVANSALQTALEENNSGDDNNDNNSNDNLNRSIRPPPPRSPPPGSFAATQSPKSAGSGGESSGDSSGGNSGNSGNSGTSILSLTKKKKKRKEPKVQFSGVVNYGDIGVNQNSDSESDTASTTSNQQQGYNLPFNMQSAFPTTPPVTDEVDDDELSQRTPIPKAPPNSFMNTILPKHFLRNRSKSDGSLSEISEDDSVIKRQKREEENVGRLVFAAKQQQSFAQAWFSAGQSQNALPPIPPKKTTSGVKKTKIVLPPKSSSGPIDLDSGEAWNDGPENGDNRSKTDWEIGSFNYGTTHSMPTKKRANKKMIQFGVPEDEDLTTYYIENKCLDRIVCTIGDTRCSFLAVLVFGFFTLLLSGGAIAAGIFFTQKISIIEPTSAPSKLSISPSLIPSSTPTDAPTLIPSSTPSLSSQPSSVPSDQPSSCFSSVAFEGQGPSQSFSETLNAFGADRNGYSVSMSANGRIAAISAILYPADSGSVSIYELSNNNNQWNPKGGIITGEESFGSSVELSDDGLSIVIGSPSSNFQGLARVYRFDATSDTWEQIGPDITEYDSESAGNSVSISGDGQVVAIGDPLYGRVMVYTFDGVGWTQRGNAIEGSQYGEFGYSVSLTRNGNIVACGSPRGSNFNIAGSVQILEWDGSQWNPLGQEIESFLFELSRFGDSVSIADDESTPRIAVGSPEQTVDFQNMSGSVSVWEYDRQSQFWFQKGDDMIGIPTRNQKFGFSVSIAGDGTHVGVGLPFSQGKGEAYVYFYNGDIWDAIDPLLGAEFGSDFGHSVDLSKDGTSLLVGASSPISLGYWQVFKSSKDCEYLG